LLAFASNAPCKPLSPKQIQTEANEASVPYGNGVQSCLGRLWGRQNVHMAGPLLLPEVVPFSILGVRRAGEKKKGGQVTNTHLVSTIQLSSKAKFAPNSSLSS
jgi:hypothetical protein